MRIPPQSIPSEQAVLGSIMLRKDAMHEVEDMITPDSFYVEKHKKIFQAMLDLSLKNEPIDHAFTLHKTWRTKISGSNRRQSISRRDCECRSLVAPT